MVKANPSLIPSVPFIENIFPGAKNYQITGSASANYFYDTWGTYAGSELDGLNDMDRQRQANGQCLSVYGCNTFFACRPLASPPTSNAGHANYNGLQIVLRRAFSSGWGFDFNYTWSHSLDNSSGTEAVIGSDSGFVQSQLLPRSFRFRHPPQRDGEFRRRRAGRPEQETAGENAAKFVDAIIGGWQISSLISMRSGTPINVSNGGIYSTNYLSSAIGILATGSDNPAGFRTLRSKRNTKHFREHQCDQLVCGRISGH